MAKTKQQKEEIVAKLSEAFKAGASTVFVHFKQLTVADETAMRRQLRSEGVKYTVAKKTLIRRALESLGLDGSAADLEGEVAIASDAGGGDSTAAARLVHGFAKTFGAEKLSIVGGIFEGVLKSRDEMRDIATIPGMDVLRGMFANVISSPRARFAVALSEVAKTKN